MNIGSMLNELISDHYRKSRPAARSTSSSFGEWIVEAAPGQRIVDLEPNHKMIVQENIAPIRIPGPNCIYSGADGLGQSAYVEYTEDSTAEDPVVRITGRSLSGEYDQIVHINDIDPANAAYPELCALMRHLSKTGRYSLGGLADSPLPSEVERGDYSKRQDFTRKLEACVAKNQRYNPDVARQAKELLSLYEAFVTEQAGKTDAACWEKRAEALLDYAGRARADNRL